VDEFRVKQILVTYIPPLGQSQAEAIATEIAKISTKELMAATKGSEPKSAAKKSSKKSGSQG